MAVQIYISAEVFTKALLGIGNGRIPVGPSTGLILFPPIFLTIDNVKRRINFETGQRLTVAFKEIGEKIKTPAVVR